MCVEGWVTRLSTDDNDGDGDDVVVFVVDVVLSRMRRFAASWPGHCVSSRTPTDATCSTRQVICTNACKPDRLM